MKENVIRRRFRSPMPVYSRSKYGEKTMNSQSGKIEPILTKVRSFRIPTKWSRLLSSGFMLLCALGFIFQVQTISTIYFAYETATDIYISLPKNVTIPDFSLCVRYADVFNLKRFKAAKDGKEEDGEYGIDLDSGASDKVLTLQKFVTIADIFKFTPKFDEVWHSCLTRRVNDYNVITTYGDNCTEIFRTRKFYIQEFICYNFHQIVSENRTYDYRNIAFSLRFPGLFFGIILNKTDAFKKAEFLRGVAHSYVGLPVDSLALSPTFNRRYDASTGEAKYNLFQVSYSQLIKSLMRPPYTTNCRDYAFLGGAGNQRGCVNQCLNETIVKWVNKVPFSVLQRSPIDLYHVNTEDIQNRTFSAEMDDVETECEQECKQSDCDDSYTISSLLKEEKADDEEGLRFMIAAPREPTFRVVHRPLMPFTDYLVYVLSCFGTWFGLSVLSMNPFSFQAREEEKKKKVVVDEFCRETRKKVQQEVREDFILLSRLVAQSKWGPISQLQNKTVTAGRILPLSRRLGIFESSKDLRLRKIY